MGSCYLLRGLILALLLGACGQVAAASAAENAALKNSAAENSSVAIEEGLLAGVDSPAYNPIIERYILEELKQLRVEQHQLRSDFVTKVAQAQLATADRAISYTADTTNNIFYLITATASIMVLLGWRSLSDIKANIQLVTKEKLAELTDKYEQRLDEMEGKLKRRSDQIIAAQEEISNTNLVHSLWMRAGLEKSDQERMSMYDQILEINPEDTEAMTYKADVLLDQGELKWALSLVEEAIALDSEYAMAYWQRACAKAALNRPEDAIDDIEVAIGLSDALGEELCDETLFESLKGIERFDALIVVAS